MIPLPPVGVNPMATFSFKGNGFFLAAGYAHSVNLSEPTTTLVNNDNTDGPGTVMFPAGEHTAKLQKRLASPKSPRLYGLQLCQRPILSKWPKK